MMKQQLLRMLSLLLVLQLLHSGGALAEAPAGTAQIDSDPQGADIYLDGVLYRPAVTPCELPLSAGTHTLSVRMAGYDDYETTVQPGDSLSIHLKATIPDGPNVRTITVDRDDHNRADARILKWEYYERFVLNGEPRPEAEWYDGQPESDYYPEWAYDALTDGISLREAICIAENDTGWYDEAQRIRWHYVIEFAAQKHDSYSGEDEPNVYYQGGSFTCYGRGSAAWINGEPLFMRYTDEGLVEDTAAKALWNGDGCFTINGDRNRDGIPDVTLAGIEEYGWDGRQGLSLLCSDVHVVGLDFASTMHVSMGKPFWQPLNYFNLRDFYITGCRFSRDSSEGDLPDRFFGTGLCQIYGETAEGYGQAGTYDLDGFYLTGCEFHNELVGFIFSGSDMDYARAKNLVIQGNHVVNGEIFVRNQDAHTWYMWPYDGVMSGTAYGENCIGVADYNSLENVTISGNRIEYTADAIPQVAWDSGYGSSINIGNSNLGGSHNTMRNVTVRCNTTRLEQANIDAFQHWGNAGISISNADVGDGLDALYDGALASSLCQVSDNLFENLTVEYNDFDVNCFNLGNISLAGTAQVGTNNNFRNIRIEHNRIRSVKGLHIFGASGTSNMGCEAEGALENLTISDNEITALRKTGWGAESNINSSDEQNDYGIQLIGASVADQNSSSWDEPGEPAAWDKLQSKVSGIAIDGNRVTGFANGILVAAAECGRTHYVTGIGIDDVAITGNEIKTDGVNRNCRNDGIALVGAIDGGTGCTVHRVRVSGNQITANNGLLAAGFWYRGVTCRWGIRDNQVLHVTAEGNRFTHQDPTGNGGFPVVTTDAVSNWGEIPYALGRSSVMLTESGSSASGFQWKSMKLSDLSLRKPASPSGFVSDAQHCSDQATSSGYIQWSKDSFAAACEVPLFLGVCDQPNYRPGGCHRYYLSPFDAWEIREIEQAPDCTTDGGIVEALCCPVCHEALDSAPKSVLPALGHAWGAPRYTWSADNSEVTAEAECTRCGDRITETVQTVSEVTTAPTLTNEGVRIYTAFFENEAFTTQTKTEPIPVLDPSDPCAYGHSWGAPSYVWSEDSSSVTATRVCMNDPAHVETETVQTHAELLLAPSFEAEGEMRYTAVFTNPAFAAQRRTAPVPKLSLPCDGENCPGVVFTDMPPKGNWAHDAIDWAIVNKVTAGTSKTTFSPNAGCTRGQVVTFLWRAAGQPEPQTDQHPFRDLQEGAFYYKAVLWAVEHKVTAGTSPTTFSPGATCTRGQIVTFLWRFEGEPAALTANNPFTDVQPGAYYGKAVLWAVENGITNGTSPTRFSPNATCTRAQVVTFLYRDILQRG